MTDLHAMTGEKDEAISDLEDKLSYQKDLVSGMVDEEIAEGVLADIAEQIRHLKEANEEGENKAESLQKLSDENELKATTLHLELLTAQAEVLTERQLVKQTEQEKQEAELELSAKTAQVAHLTAHNQLMKKESEKSSAKLASLKADLTRQKKLAADYNTQRRIDNQASREKIEKLQEENRKLQEEMEEMRVWKKSLEKMVLAPATASPNGKRKLVVQQPDSTLSSTDDCDEDEEPLSKKQRRYGKQI